MLRLTLRQLSYFTAIVQAGSLTRAARHAHVAPTALSLQIKAMEDEFGVALLRRHSRGVAVTPAGSDLFARSQEIIALVEAAEASLAGFDDRMPGLIRLGAPPAIAQLIGADAIRGAADRFQGVTIELVQDWSFSLEQRLRAGALDVMVGYGLRADQDIRIHPIAEDELVFAAAPALIGGSGPIRLAEALEANLVFYGANSVGWRATSEEAVRAGLRPPGEAHVGTIDLWLAVLRSGLGSTITSYNAIAAEHARGAILVRRIVDPPIRRDIAIACRSDLRPDGWFQGFAAFLSDLVTLAQSRLRRAFQPD